MAAYPNFLTDRARGCSPENGVNPDIFHANPRTTANTNLPHTGKATQQREQARNVCRSCPFTAACFTWTEQQKETDGIWGGVDMASSIEREKARSRYGLATTKPAPDLPLADRVLVTRTARFRHLSTADRILVIQEGLRRGIKLGTLAHRFGTPTAELQTLIGEDPTVFDQRVRDLHAAGKSDSAIALTLACNPKRVANSRERQQLPALYGPGGRPVDQPAADIPTRPARRGPLDQQVRELYDQDLNDTQIAERLGTTDKTIRNIRARKLGLTTKFGARGRRLAVTA
jgi:hypothetical protein